MEAAAVAWRGGALARARPGARTRLHGVGAGGPGTRRRFPVAVTVAQEIALVDEDVASTAVLPPPDVSSPDPAKTMHVKFVLQKQCAFGQQFLVVGDDPALSLWDPTKATVLDWSEGHVWTARKDLPASKSIEFKFLLQDPSGQVRWQHGYNRTLQITETSNVLVVHEDWDDAECQKVSEEVDVSIGADVIFAGSDEPLMDENQEHDNGVTTVVSADGEKTSAVFADASMLRERMWVNGANQAHANDASLGIQPWRKTKGSGRASQKSKHGSTKWQSCCCWW